MTRTFKRLAALTALALPLAAYGIASAQQDANPQAPPQGQRTGPQGQTMGPEMQGEMMNMMKMMGQMTEMMETCNTMMKTAMQKNGQGGQAPTAPHKTN
jgi:hypothetical protein